MDKQPIARNRDLSSPQPLPGAGAFFCQNPSPSFFSPVSPVALAGGAILQRQVVQMPPMQVPVGMPSDLSALSTPQAPGSMTVGRTTTQIAANSQLPQTPLPFTPGGWDGDDIARKLGQYDRIPGTDSDAVRCVQAVALMSHILMGPEAAVQYLTSISLQGMLQARRIGVRERTALRVIDFVKSQIQSGRASYGNMYWAMEAVHDLFYGDASGTPASTPGTVREQITPMLDLSQQMIPQDLWCANRSELLTQAASLKPGEQFMVNTWSVSFNAVFDEVGVPQTQQRLSYGQTDERGRTIGRVSIRRIDTTQKPGAARIDLNRDHKHGHQMMIFKDAVSGHVKLYEPEITLSGTHLFDLTTDPSVIDSMLFFDQPAFELYEYVEIWGKMVPGLTASPLSP